MQTTLLGLAVALILALVAALVGPHFVDWGRYRIEFETEASRLVGVPVRIAGPIEVRLLPVPSLALHSVELSSGETAFSARSLRFELALGPLMRGEWRVSELALDEPRFRIGFDSAGRLQAPPVKADWDANSLSIDRLVIANGRAVLVDDASKATLTLKNLSFAGDMRSLSGPVRGDGWFVLADGPYRFRLHSGRAGPGGTRVRVDLEGVERPLMAEADGTLLFDATGPHFEGSLSLARPAGVALPGGRTLAREPWRLTTQIKADSRRLLADAIEFQYGPEERSLRLAGKADVALGADPRFKGALSARQLDLDKLVGLPEPGRRSPGAILLVSVRRLFEESRAPPLPGKLDLEFDTLTIGGATLQGLRGTVGVASDQWDIESLDFRAPGLTQVRLTGRLETQAGQLEFAGPISLESNDPRALWAFIGNGSEAPRSAPIAPLQASGELVIGDQGIVIDRLRAEIDQKRIEGRLAYAPTSPSGPARLDAALRADEIDLDRTLAIAAGAFAGAKLEWPHNVFLALAAGRVSYAELEAGRFEAKLKLEAGALTVERFSIADLHGASVNASGLIDLSSTSPHGALSLALNAPRADRFISFAGRFLPDAAEQLRRHGGQLAPAELRARLELGPAKTDSAPPRAGTAEARFTINGKLGAVRVNLAALGTGDPATALSARMKVDGSLEADDGKVLAALVGIDQWVMVDTRPAAISLSANGRLDGDLAFELRATAGGFGASGVGSARQERGVFNGRATLALNAADARLLLNSGAPAALPLAIESRFVFSGPALAFEDIKGQVAGSGIAGQASLRLATPLGLDGDIQATDIDAGQIITGLVGTLRRATPSEHAAGWSAEPFVRPVFTYVRGGVSFKAARAALLPGLAASDLKGRATFDGNSLSLEGVTGVVAGGPANGNATFEFSPTGMSARARFDLAKGDLAEISFGRSKPPAAGRLAFAAEVEGAGRSPAALIGALRGTGSVSLEDLQIPGLDPKAVDVALRAADRGLAPDRLATYLGPALDAGRLVVPHASAALAILDGRIRILPVTVAIEGTDVGFSGTLNLTDNDLDARITLSGEPREELKGRRPELSIELNGPLPTAKRTIDTADLASYVMLRTVERQSKRVEAAEREAKRRAEAAAAAAAAGADRAPALPPPNEVAPRPVKPAPSAPAARPAPPPNRLLWDGLFGRP